MFTKLRKVNQVCQSIWPAIDKEKINIKSESVSAGIPNNSHKGVSASYANKENDKRVLNANAIQEVVSAGSADKTMTKSA